MTKRSDIIEGSKAAGATHGVVYSCKCGWIDLGHGTAKSTRPFVGAHKLWEQMTLESGEKSPNGLWHFVRYRQDMSKTVFGRKFSDDFTRDYAVLLGLSVAQKEAVALSIFQEVSVGFEELQGSWLYSWKDSSFSGEDLMSNLIGFYRVVRPGTDYLKLCEPVPKADAEQVWDKFGAPGDAANKNHSFGPYLYPCKSCSGGPGTPVCGLLPAALSTIQPVPIGALYRKWDRSDPAQAIMPVDPAPSPTKGPATLGPAAPKVVSLVKGDTLSGLSAFEYKDWRLWPLLWDANHSVIGSNPNRLKIGTSLRIPPLEAWTSQQKADASRRSPQWKIFPY